MQLAGKARHVRMIGATIAFLGSALLWQPAYAQDGQQGSAAPPAPTSPPATTQPPTAEALKGWHAGMRSVPPPKEGCFTSAYPSTEWKEVPCTTAPAVPYLPARGGASPRAGVVGNGVDVSAQVSSQIFETVGSFENTSGITSETGPQGPNAFSLQINSNFFSSPACAGATNPGSCQGWQQFVHSNYYQSTFMQYWLLNYGPAKCPPGWTSYQNDCYKNSAALSVPTQPITNLINLSVTGLAVSGGLDTLILSTGTQLYSVTGQDSVVTLAQGWQDSEFNIVGDCCGYQANFNSGAAIAVRISVNSGSPPSRSAPSCYGAGFTGETNNLSFAPAPADTQQEPLPAIVFLENSTGGAAYPCAAATYINASNPLVDAHDFNANGKSDILWRDTSGNAALWLMNGGQVSSSKFLGNVPMSWTVVGQRDFNGDGYADILWRDGTGNVAMWLMNGGQLFSSVFVGNVPTSWSIAGTGDFNSDGKGDILWHDTSGNTVIWFMNGGAVASSAFIANVATSWSIAGSSRNGIVWRDTSGNTALWLMNGGTVTSSVFLGNVATTWSIVGVGDFNGDNNVDLLWRDTSGNIAMWFLNNNGQVTSSAFVANVATTWSIAETGDFNGDGKSDILWRDTSGNTAIWFMNGGAIMSSASVANVATSWTIQGMNAD